MLILLYVFLNRKGPNRFPQILKGALDVTKGKQQDKMIQDTGFYPALPQTSCVALGKSPWLLASHLKHEETGLV